MTSFIKICIFYIAFIKKSIPIENDKLYQDLYIYLQE